MATGLQVSSFALWLCWWGAAGRATTDVFLFFALQSVQTFGRKVSARSQRPLFSHSTIDASIAHVCLFALAEDSSGCGLCQAWQGSA